MLPAYFRSNQRVYCNKSKWLAENQNVYTPVSVIDCYESAFNSCSCLYLFCRFSIRFGTKAKDDKIIGFRLQALLDSKTIALNSRINGSWGTEEKHTSVFPFEKDESFDINIVVKLDAIKASCVCVCVCVCVLFLLLMLLLLLLLLFLACF